MLAALILLAAAPTDYASNWRGLPDRVWVGAEVFQNCLQDWRVEGGRVVCTEGRPNLPARTLQLLTRHLADGPGTFASEVLIGQQSDQAPNPASWVGIQFGQGGPEVHYRITALVHHQPAEDGGLIAVIDGTGRVHLRDFSQTLDNYGPWSLSGPLNPERVPELPSTTRVDSGFLGRFEPIVLRVEATSGNPSPTSAGFPVPRNREERGRGEGSRSGFGLGTSAFGSGNPSPTSAGERGRGEGSQSGFGLGASAFGSGNPSPTSAGERGRGEGSETYRVTLTATTAIGRRVISEATYDNVPAHQLAGGVGLFSHLGPEGEEATYWFDAWRLTGTKVRRHDERAFGPVFGAQYTLGKGLLKLTAQFPPLAPGEDRVARLEFFENYQWRPVSQAAIDSDSFTARFRVEPYVPARDTVYRVVFQGKPVWNGVVRAEPKNREFVLAALTCNKVYTGDLHWNGKGLWQPHADIVTGVREHGPDLVYFSGDQIYEGDLTPARRQPEGEAFLDYLYKWNRFLWAFGDLMRDVPSITIPDDHDVYHGNLWGAGGKKGQASPGITAQDSGGYTMPAAFVNAVHRTQTSHLPDPVDPAPVEQGISVYFTRLEYGGVSFAILGDRQFKSSPTIAVPEGKFVNGWPQAEGYDPRKADVPGAVLLGERQERFLEQWAGDWSHGAWMKVLLSQSPFTNVATLPADDKSGEAIPGLKVYKKGEYPPDDRPVSDGDSNGWPQTPRNRALRLVRSAFAVHVTGDQHLGSLVQYGVDAWRDAGFAFCTPAIANTWPRRWMPAESGANPWPGAPRYTGDYLDGFGNKMTVWAAANPYQTGVEPTALHDRVPGYGIVRFVPSTRIVTFECWPRWRLPAPVGLGHLPHVLAGLFQGIDSYWAPQFDGWPKTVLQADNYSPRGRVLLPEVTVEGLPNPVLQLVGQASSLSSTPKILYTLRIQGQSHRPWAPEAGEYTLRVGDPDAKKWKEIPLSTTSKEKVTIKF